MRCPLVKNFRETSGVSNTGLSGAGGVCAATGAGAGVSNVVAEAKSPATAPKRNLLRDVVLGCCNNGRSELFIGVQAVSLTILSCLIHLIHLTHLIQSLQYQLWVDSNDISLLLDLV